MAAADELDFAGAAFELFRKYLVCDHHRRKQVAQTRHGNERIDFLRQRPGQTPWAFRSYQADERHRGLGARPGQHAVIGRVDVEDQGIGVACCVLLNGVFADLGFNTQPVAAILDTLADLRRAVQDKGCLTGKIVYGHACHLTTLNLRCGTGVERGNRAVCEVM